MNYFKMIKQLIYILILLIISFSCDNSSQENNALTFEKLLVNAKENPSAIERKQPLFSWLVNAEGYNKSQSSYHILIASSEDKLSESAADIWNSEKVDSDQSTFVKYKGEPLEAMTTYFWKVRIWDEANAESSWSKIQKFKMGLMHESNWSDSKWIS